MPVYSYSDDSLTLILSPRLKKIIKRYKEFNDGETLDDLDDSDIEYLINAAARWNTFYKCISQDKFDIDVEVYNDTVNLSELLGDLVRETNGLNAVDFENNFKVYKYACDRVTIIGATGSDVEEIVAEIPSAIRHVTTIENDFKKRGQDIKVIGYFKSVEQEGLSLELTSDSIANDVINEYLAKKAELIESKKANLDKELALIDSNKKN